MYASKKADSNTQSFVPSNIITLTCQAIYALESPGNHNGSNESHVTSRTLLILSCNLKINIIIYRPRGNVARSQEIMVFSLLLLHIKTGSDLCHFCTGISFLFKNVSDCVSLWRKSNVPPLPPFHCCIFAYSNPYVLTGR
jgi:hypothetical protein